MSDDFPTAAMAREKSSGVASAAVARAMGEVRRAIESAVASGRRECSPDHAWGQEVAEAVCRLLAEKGYTATHGDSQIQGSWITVRW